MNRREESAFLVLAASSLWPLEAFAEEAAKPAGFGATDFVWVTVIGLILVYGVYDTFFKAP